MNWIAKLERRFGRRYIPNLISYIVAGQIVVEAIELFLNQNITYSLMLWRTGLAQGQLWRLVTFIFVPFASGGILEFIIGTYFLWFIGSALEKEWGDFRFNLYILFGMLGAILACLLTGSAGTYTLSMSLFFAFALLYPNMQVLLFFVIPVKVKYMGMIAAVMWCYAFLTSGMSGMVNYLCCILNFIVFFGGSLLRNIRAKWRREQWKRNNRR